MTDNTPPLFTIDEIKQMQVDLQTAQHCLDQCEKRMHYLLDSAEIIERKAVMLFNAYVLLIGAAASISALSDQYTEMLIIPACCLVFGVIMLAAILYPMTQGTVGISPEDWLMNNKYPHKGYSLAQKLLVLCYHYQKRHENSEHSNRIKRAFLYASVVSGVVAVVIATVLMSCT